MAVPTAPKPARTRQSQTPDVGPTMDQAVANAFADAITSGGAHGRGVVSRFVFWMGPAQLLASCAVAFAADGSVPPLPGATTGADYLLSTGPYGALVRGAHLLGRGVRVAVQIELSEMDLELIERSNGR